MKCRAGLSLILILCLRVSAQYLPANDSSTIQFKIKNFGFAVSGSFTGLTGTIQFDPANLSSAHFDVSIDANSVNTGVEMRDNHLREPEYFDISKYHRIHFASTRISTGKRGGYLMEGKLTIKNMTKYIDFPFSTIAVSGGYRFTGTFSISRQDFGIGGVSTISDNLDVSLDVLAKIIKN
jgi:polyisoprenoid-binding protein YceI